MKCTVCWLVLLSSFGGHVFPALAADLAQTSARTTEFKFAFGKSEVQQGHAYVAPQTTCRVKMTCITATTGGYELARCVVEGIKVKVPEQAKHFSKDVGTLDPANPDPPDNVEIPAGPIASETKGLSEINRENEGKENVAPNE